MKNKGFVILFCLNILLCIVDFTTTLMNKDIYKYFETNQLYQYTGSFVPVFLLNLAFFIGIYWLYYRESTSPTVRFALINAMVVIAMVRCYAINNAIYWLQHPISVEVAKQIATPQAIQAQQYEVMKLTYQPYLLTFITYLFFQWDNIIKKKE